MSKEEQIRTAIDNLDEQTAKDALALLLAGNTAGLKRPEFTSSTETDSISGSMKFANFSQAILWLKSKYKFQELDAFSTEADLVYVNTGDRKILLTDTSAKAKQVSGEGRSLHLDDFENAWENIVSNKKNPENVGQIAEYHNRESDNKTEQNNPEEFDQAFEPLPKNSRFSNLEL